MKTAFKIYRLDDSNLNTVQFGLKEVTDKGLEMRFMSVPSAVKKLNKISESGQEYIILPIYSKRND